MAAPTIRAGHELSSHTAEPLGDGTSMIDPTLIKTEQGRSRRRSGLLITIAIALAVAGVFGAGLYALVRPHSGATVSTSMITSDTEMPSVAR